jgi:phospholipid transport system substrate-binding protein
MMSVRVLAIALGCVALVASPASAAGPATEQLKGAIDRVLKVLEDPNYKGPGKQTQRRAAVRKIADDIFDFPEVARRSLARHWQTLTDKQRDEFVGLFSDLLERSYISKIELYGGEKISYLPERVDADITTVPTRFLSKSGTEIPVDYRMHKKGDKWLVYDVNIEGVSLVSNYRTQFNKIIQTASYSELVQKLKNKQIEFTTEDKGKDKAEPAKK